MSSVEKNVSDTPRSDAALRWQEDNPDADAVVNYGFAQEMERALRCAANVLFLLEPEVKALGCRADRVLEKIRAALDE